MVFTMDEESAEFYAIIYQELRRKGRSIPANDIRIAATALQHDLAIFSYDRHFQEVAGLVVGSSLTDLSL